MALNTRRSFLRKSAATLLAPGAAAFGSVRAPATGPFVPTWESLAAYQTPDWFRDAKFGIWAHWGPQCVPEQGDWYARNMYREGQGQYKYQCEHYGHPSRAGFKDIIHQWKAENWDPEHLVGLYKKAGAKYFMAMANHHDNFDNYDSKYQPWNSVNLGPKKDLIGGWEKAARRAGLRFAVSSHAAHAWSWYEVAQGADKSGPLAGVPYDGKLTKADGKGLWWEGRDPQELYAQNHAPGAGGLVWDWNAARGSSLPDAAYCEKFYNRTIDLIDKYHPDLLYFDDTVLPLHPISDVGLRIAAYQYNTSIKRSGKLEGVVTGKVLSPAQRKCLVWDIERGVSNTIEPLPWQTDTCIGQWHYSRPLFERKGYKKPGMVAQMLVDIISKNGNLMLNIPLPGGGAPDSEELAFLSDFTDWMHINSDAIYGTRPWKVSGEGPSVEAAAEPLRAQGFNEGRNKPYVAQDLRFVTKGDDTLYAFAMGWPNGESAQTLTIKSLASGSPLAPGRVERVNLLGVPGPLKFTRTTNGLVLTLPAQKPCDYVYAFKIRGRGIV